MKGCLSEMRRGGHGAGDGIGRMRDVRSEGREKERSLFHGGKLELYSLLSIFGTSLASPRQNPALAPS